MNTYLNLSNQLHKVNFNELNPSEDIELRPYQTENKTKIYDYWKNGRTVMLQMPTGTGKTRLFVSIIKDLHNWAKINKNSVKVLILAHRQELIDQISEHLGYKYSLAHGIIMAQNREQKYLPIQVASVQTLNRRLDQWVEKDFDIIIVDEAHHVKAESYKKILKEFPNAKILGVTATPYRMNGAGFTDVFENLIVSKPISWFINEHWLADYKYYSIEANSKIQKSIDSINRFAIDGDYEEKAMLEVMDKDHIRAKVVQSYKQIANDKKGIVYTISKSHNENICKQFNDNGIPARAIDSDTPKEIRQQYVNDFVNGKFKVLCNVNIFSEGFDCPDVEFIQMARPTKSLSMYLQQIGRGLRTSEDKEEVIVIDNVGLYNRFGLPSANRMWKKHFLGEEVNETQIKPTDENYNHRVEFIDDYEEGDEEITLIQNTTNIHNITEKSSTDETFDNLSVEEKLELIENEISVFEKHNCPVPTELIKQKDLLKNLLRIKDLVNEIIKKAIENGYNISYTSDNVYISEKQSIIENLETVNYEISTFEKYHCNIPDSLSHKKEVLISQIEYINNFEKFFKDFEKIKMFEWVKDEGYGLSIANERIDIKLKNKNLQNKNNYHNSNETIVKKENKTKYEYKAKNKIIKITFEDGTIICENKVSKTICSFIAKVGAKDVFNLNILVGEYKLVSDRICDYYGRKLKEVDGYYILTNTNTGCKFKQIEEIINRLNIKAKVEMI